MIPFKLGAQLARSVSCVEPLDGFSQPAVHASTAEARELSSEGAEIAGESVSPPLGRRPLGFDGLEFPLRTLGFMLGLAGGSQLFRKRLPRLAAGLNVVDLVH